MSAITLLNAARTHLLCCHWRAASTVSTAKEDTAAALAEVTESSYHSIAQLSCFLDPVPQQTWKAWD